MSKSRLEEIAKKVCARCSPWERDALIRMGRAVIAEAEKWCEEPFGREDSLREAFGRSYDARGDIGTAADLLKHLRSLDAPKPLRGANITHMEYDDFSKPKDPCPGCGRHDPYCDCSDELKRQYKPKEDKEG